MPDSDQRPQLVPFVGKFVRASGEVYERMGTRAIVIRKIEEDKTVPLVKDALQPALLFGMLCRAALDGPSREYLIRIELPSQRPGEILLSESGNCRKPTSQLEKSSMNSIT